MKKIYKPDSPHMSHTPLFIPSQFVFLSALLNQPDVFSNIFNLSSHLGQLTHVITNTHVNTITVSDIHIRFFSSHITGVYITVWVLISMATGSELVLSLEPFIVFPLPKNWIQSGTTSLQGQEQASPEAGGEVIETNECSISPPIIFPLRRRSAEEQWISS